MLQSKALGAQQQEVATAVTAAGDACRQWLAKLQGMEKLLFSAQSSQFLDIRKREADAFKVSCTPTHYINRRVWTICTILGAVHVHSEIQQTGHMVMLCPG